VSGPARAGSIRLLITNFHSGDSGGHRTYIETLATRLSPRYERFVACPETSDVYQSLASANFPGRLIGEPFPAKPREIIRVLEGIARFKRLLRELRPALIHVNGSPDHRMVMFATLANAPRPRIVLTKHNTIPVKTGLSRWLRARAFTDHVIAVGRSAATVVEDSPYRALPVTVVPNGIDLSIFHPCSEDERTQARRNYGVPHDSIVLVSVAGTGYHKGWWVLTQALRTLPPGLRIRFRVLIAGMPLEPASIERECGKLVDEGVVRFVGKLDRVVDLIHSADAGFVLSYGVETISFACREMMACGLPVLVSEYADLSGNVTDGVEGWIVGVKNVQQVSAWLHSVAEGAFDLRAMGRAARLRAQREFGVEAMIAATEAVYEATLDASDSRVAS
jgi:L-malate glycosyltransferase